MALSISSIAELLPKLQIKDEVLHAVFETLGCMLALGIAGFLLMRHGESGNGYMMWLTCSVLVTGIIDTLLSECNFIGAHSVVYVRYARG